MPRFRQTAAQPSTPPLKVSEGQWVRVPVPSGSFPVSIMLGNRAPTPAYIDRIRTESGIVEHAIIRCPEVPRGVYDVQAITPTGIISTTVEVI